MADHPLDVLERQLEQAARRQLAPSRRRSRRVILLAALLGTFTVAGGAWAVTSLLPVGSPVAYRLGSPAPGKGFGTPVAGTVRMLTATVPDPAGGLPWGLRSFATSRGYTCLQIGRVQAHRLGFIGLRDRRFHELRPGVVTDQRQCVVNDGADRGFLALHFDALPAGGDRTSCTSLPRTATGLPRCRASELRSVDFGLLGPHATAITYRAEGKLRDARLLGPDRGYLVVGPAKPPRVRRARGMFMVETDEYAALTPVSPVLTGVQYGTGRSCRVTAVEAPQGSCGAPPGFVPNPPPTPAEVRARVSAEFVRGDRLRVRFKAPVAITDSKSTYNVLVRPPSCGAGRGAKSANIEHNVAAGENVFKDFMHFCRGGGRFRIVVRYLAASPNPRPGSLRPGTLVGRATITR